MPELPEGLVQVYTGSGKGKTSAALGLALRAVGHGLRVCLIHFLKRGWPSGELAAAPRLAPELEVRVFGSERWGDRTGAADDTPWWELPPSDEDRSQAQEALASAKEALTSGRWDIVILDEVLGALKGGLISLDQVLSFICAKPPNVEVVLTGREAPPEVIKVADLVTEMVEVKHPYQRGLTARKGIEY